MEILIRVITVMEFLTDLDSIIGKMDKYTAVNSRKDFAMVKGNGVTKKEITTKVIS